MQINTHVCNTLSLQEVRQLLPPDHHVLRFDDSVPTGPQPDGNYYVVRVIFYSGRKALQDTCRARLHLLDVLQHVDPQSKRIVDCFVHGAFCDAVEESIPRERECDGSWQERPGSSGVWLVLHRPYVHPYMGCRQNRHPLMFVLGHETTPQGQMWVFRGLLNVTIPATQCGSRASTPLLLSLPPCEPTAPPLTTTTTTTTTTITTTIVPGRPSTSSTSRLKETHKWISREPLYISSVSPTPTSSTHPCPPTSGSRLPPPATLSSAQSQSPAQTHSPTPAESLVRAESPALAQSSAQDKHSAETVSPVPVKRRALTKSPSKPRSLAQTRSSAQAKPPAQARTPAQARPTATQKIRIQWRLRRLTEAREACRLSAAAVVVEVVKEGHLTRNNTTFDIIKVADKGLARPSARQTHMMIKVFHNDGLPWPEGVKPEKGQVVVLKDMLIEEHRGCLEGIVYSTKMTCLCVCDENNHLTWYTYSDKCPHNIENAERVVLELIQWWRTEGNVLEFRQFGVDLSTHLAAGHPTKTIAEAGAKGLFTLYCQVIKKTLYPSLMTPRYVLRVCDGTRTSYRFEEITRDPTNRLDNSPRNYGPVGSLEVYISVICTITLAVLDSVQEGSFVELKGLDCKVLPGGRRKIIFLVGGEEESVRVLDNEEPRLGSLRSAVEQARAEMALDDDSHMDIEEEVDNVCRLSASEGPAQPHTTTTTTPSPAPSPELALPSDSFEMFVMQKGWTKSFKSRESQKDPMSAVQQQLNHATPGSPVQPSFPSRQPLHSQMHTPTQSAYPTTPPCHTTKHASSPQTPSPRQKCSNSPQSSTSRQALQPSSPQCSTSRQAPQSSSPQCSTSRQALQPSSPQSSTSRQALQPSSPQSSTSRPALQPSTSRQPLCSSSPQAFSVRQSFHPSSPKSPTSRQPQHPPSPQPSTSKQPQQHASLQAASDQMAPSVQELQQDHPLKAPAADTTTTTAATSTTPTATTATTTESLTLSTEVVGEAKETNLETFHLEGKVGEVYRVKAVIEDIRVITGKSCCCSRKRLCLHQWVWGQCGKCSTTFSSTQLLDFNSFLALKSLQCLPCRKCHCYDFHSSNNEGEGGGEPLPGGREEQPEVVSSHCLHNPITPFIKIKVVLSDPASHLLLAPWLVGESATLFFGVSPSFKWIIKEGEVQETVEALLSQENCAPLALGLMKKVVAGSVDLYIVNTVLHTSPSGHTVPSHHT